jgi:hypothetical protein
MYSSIKSNLFSFRNTLGILLLFCQESYLLLNSGTHRHAVIYMFLYIEDSSRNSYNRVDERSCDGPANFKPPDRIIRENRIFIIYIFLTFESNRPHQQSTQNIRPQKFETH